MLAENIVKTILRENNSATVTLRFFGNHQTKQSIKNMASAAQIKEKRVRVPSSILFYFEDENNKKINDFFAALTKISREGRYYKPVMMDNAPDTDYTWVELEKKMQAVIDDGLAYKKDVDKFTTMVRQAGGNIDMVDTPTITYEEITFTFRSTEAMNEFADDVIPMLKGSSVPFEIIKVK